MLEFGPGEPDYRGAVVPLNPTATSLVANAYKYTGDDTYKDRAVRHVKAWTERMGHNNGI